MLMPAWPRWMPPPHSQFMVHTYGVRMGAWLLGTPRAGQHVLTQPSSSRLGRQGRGLRMLLLLLGSGGGSGLRSSAPSDCSQGNKASASLVAQRCAGWSPHAATTRGPRGPRGPREERGRREGTKGGQRACACMGMAWAVPLPG